MPERKRVSPKVPPASFGQYNQAQSRRVVQLTEKAIAQLQAAHQSVTLVAVAELTRSLDNDGKGISSRTILRNKDAAAIFRKFSSAYQERQQKAKGAKRKRASAKPNMEIRAIYRGLSSSDLVQMVEDLKIAMTQMQDQLARLQAERDEACRLRDEALEHNTRQLAALAARTKTVATVQP